MKGYVYIISNKAMPGIFKIGFTLKDPALRAKELDSPGVPYPFIVEYEILVDEPYALEQHVHKALRSQREGKEWFRCDFSQAVQTIHSCYQGKVYLERCFKIEREKELEKIKQEQLIREREQKKREEEQKRIERERQKQAEEKIRIQEIEKIKKIAAENEQKKIDKFIFMKTLETFFYIELIPFISIFIISNYLKNYFQCTLYLIITTIFALGIALELQDRYKRRWTREYNELNSQKISTANTEKYKTDQKESTYKAQDKNQRTDLERAWNEELARRGWATQQSNSSTINQSSSHQRTTTYSQSPSSPPPKKARRYVELERAWNEELIRRGWTTRQSNTSTDEQSSQKLKQILYSQATSFKAQGIKRDLELERAWREEEERRRKGREARKLQQEGKVIIECLECSQKLRVSNASCLRVICPKCDTTSYWKNE